MVVVFQFIGFIATFTIGIILLRFLLGFIGAKHAVTEKLSTTDTAGSVEDQTLLIIWRERFNKDDYPELENAFTQVKPEDLYNVILQDYPLWQHLTAKITSFDEQYAQQTLPIQNDAIQYLIDESTLESTELNHQIKVYIFAFTLIYEFLERYRRSHLDSEFVDPFHFALMGKIFGKNSLALYNLAYRCTRWNGMDINNNSALGTKLHNFARAVISNCQNDLLEYSQVAPTSLTSHLDMDHETTDRIDLPSLEAIYVKNDWTENY